MLSSFQGLKHLAQRWVTCRHFYHCESQNRELASPEAASAQLWGGREPPAPSNQLLGNFRSENGVTAGLRSCTCTNLRVLEEPWKCQRGDNYIYHGSCQENTLTDWKEHFNKHLEGMYVYASVWSWWWWAILDAVLSSNKWSPKNLLRRVMWIS